MGNCFLWDGGYQFQNLISLRNLNDERNDGSDDSESRVMCYLVPFHFACLEKFFLPFRRLGWKSEQWPV